MSSFQSHLSDPSKKRILDAHAQAELIRTRALSRVALLQRSDPDYGGSFNRSSGPGALELAEADLKAALVIIETAARELKQAGASGLDARQLLEELIENAGNSYEMTGLQKEVLRLECHRFVEDAMLPLVEPEHKESASEMPLPESKPRGAPESKPPGKNHGSQTKSPRTSTRRNPKYSVIDDGLRAAADSRPRNQKDILNSLDSRSVKLPRAEPFKSAGGWIAGFERDQPRARAWLSKNWTRLQLTPLERGPKVTTLTTRWQ